MQIYKLSTIISYIAFILSALSMLTSKALDTTTVAYAGIGFLMAMYNVGGMLWLGKHIKKGLTLSWIALIALDLLFVLAYADAGINTSNIVYILIPIAFHTGLIQANKAPEVNNDFISIFPIYEIGIFCIAGCLYILGLINLLIKVLS